jgi:hypothetical protein
MEPPPPPNQFHPCIHLPQTCQLFQTHMYTSLTLQIENLWAKSVKNVSIMGYLT